MWRLVVGRKQDMQRPRGTHMQREDHMWAQGGGGRPQGQWPQEKAGTLTLHFQPQNCRKLNDGCVSPGLWYLLMWPEPVPIAGFPTVVGDGLCAGGPQHPVGLHTAVVRVGAQDGSTSSLPRAYTQGLVIPVSHPARRGSHEAHCAEQETEAPRDRVTSSGLHG